ncbi:hypothetical protein NTJ12_002266 [Flavobacterium psychrophilum]|nr:hypothetical protein [Flavobacterium psychrophilum]
MKLLKLVTILFAILQLASCKGQDKDGVTYPKEKIMNNERFDIDRFRNYPKVVTVEQEKKLPSKRDTLLDGTIIDYSWWNDKNKTYYSKRITPPAPALFYTYKEFYQTGVIKQESELFVGKLNHYICTKEYDEQGYLVKTIDYRKIYTDVKINIDGLLTLLQKEPLLDDLTQEEKEYFNDVFALGKENKDVTLEDVFKYLRRDKILNPRNTDTTIFNTEDRFRLEISFNEDEKKWYIIKELYPFGQIWLEADANTGKVSNKTYHRETRP